MPAPDDLHIALRSAASKLLRDVANGDPKYDTLTGRRITNALLPVIQRHIETEWAAGVRSCQSTHLTPRVEVDRPGGDQAKWHAEHDCKGAPDEDHGQRPDAPDLCLCGGNWTTPADLRALLADARATAHTLTLDLEAAHAGNRALVGERDEWKALYDGLARIAADEVQMHIEATRRAEENARGWRTQADTLARWCGDAYKAGEDARWYIATSDSSWRSVAEMYEKRCNELVARFAEQGVECDAHQARYKAAWQSARKRAATMSSREDLRWARLMHANAEHRFTKTLDRYNTLTNALYETGLVGDAPALARDEIGTVKAMGERFAALTAQRDEAARLASDRYDQLARLQRDRDALHRDDRAVVLERNEARAERDAALAEVERLKTSNADLRTSGHHTSYSLIARSHDMGEHAGSDNPYWLCPRCEMEHPRGRLAQVKAERDQVRAALTRVEALCDGADEMAADHAANEISIATHVLRAALVGPGDATPAGEEEPALGTVRADGRTYAGTVWIGDGRCLPDANSPHAFVPMSSAAKGRCGHYVAIGDPICGRQRAHTLHAPLPSPVGSDAAGDGETGEAKRDVDVIAAFLAQLGMVSSHAPSNLPRAADLIDDLHDWGFRIERYAPACAHCGIFLDGDTRPSDHADGKQGGPRCPVHTPAPSPARESATGGD